MSGKRVLTFVLCLILVVVPLVMSGCSGSSDGSGGRQTSNSSGNKGSDNAQSGGAPVEISVFWRAERMNVEADNPVLKKIEEKTNVKLNMLNIPWNSYAEKMNLAISTGDTADIMMTNGPKEALWLQWIDEGVFIPLDEYLEEAGNIKKAVPDDLMEIMKVDGKIYSIPRLFPSSTHVFFVRKDWLDKFNLQPPKTLDDLYKVAKTFTENDPDSNGEKDTYGLGSFGGGGLFWLRFLATANETPWDQFKKINGEWKYCSAVPEAKKWVEFANKLYTDGVLDPEFTVIKNTQAKEKFFQGKLGMLGMPYKDYYNAINTLKKVNSDAEVIAISPPKNANGVGGWPAVGGEGDVGFWMTAAISKNCKDPAAAMRLMDFIMSPEGGELTFYGVEGTHFKKEDGKYIRLKSFEELASDGIGPNAPLSFLIHDPRYAEAYEPESELEKEMYETAVSSVYKDFLITVPMNKRMTELLPELRDFSNENLVNFIVGQRPLDEFDAYVQEWHERGGQELLDELAKEVAKQGK